MAAGSLNFYPTYSLRKDTFSRDSSQRNGGKATAFAGTTRPRAQRNSAVQCTTWSNDSSSIASAITKLSGPEARRCPSTIIAPAYRDFTSHAITLRSSLTDSDDKSASG